MELLHRSFGSTTQRYRREIIIEQIRHLSYQLCGTFPVRFLIELPGIGPNTLKKSIKANTRFRSRWFAPSLSASVSFQQLEASKELEDNEPTRDGSQLLILGTVRIPGDLRFVALSQAEEIIEPDGMRFEECGIDIFSLRPNSVIPVSL